MRKPLFVAFLTAIMVCGFSLAGILNLYTVHAATEVIGIISSDTTWTKANSPYSLTGPTAVGEGVTLTIEAGATVNLNDYYIQVNGTLHAKGSSTDKIQFNGGQERSIIFTPVSNSWNEQTGSGSIIENAILNSTRISISNVSPKINDNSIIRVGSGSFMGGNTAISISDGSPIISNNDVGGGITVSGSAVISYNNITGGMGVYGGSPVISNNNISGGSTYIGIGRSDERISNVIFIGGKYSSAVISYNNITGNGGGILFHVGAYREESVRYAPLIFGNTIYNCGTGISIGSSIAGTLTIERNLIMNNGSGIIIGHDVNLIIRSNTITGNSKGISVEYLRDEGFSKEISNNNIYANKDYNFYLEGPNDINATYNWWGTTDTQAINQTIYDFKNDFNLGTVNFVPFLTEANPEAPEIPTSTPTPTPSSTSTPSITPSPTPSPTPTPTPTQEPQQTDQTETIVGAAIAAAVIGAGLGLLIYLIKRK